MGGGWQMFDIKPGEIYTCLTLVVIGAATVLGAIGFSIWFLLHHLRWV